MYTKKIILGISLLTASACYKVEPIEISVPQREIDTQALTQYKANLHNRNITMGMLYNWTNETGSFLMRTPDSLDVIVLKDSYENISETQKNDLQAVQQKKATKVLVGLNMDAIAKAYETQKETEIANKQKEIEANKNLTTPEEKEKQINAAISEITERLSAIAKENIAKQGENILQIAKNNGFNGISIEFPMVLKDPFNEENFNGMLANIVANKGNLLLVVENPYGERGFTSDVKPIDAADWIVYYKKNNELYKSFSDLAQKFTLSRFLPSTDFSEETLIDGFSDSTAFDPDGKNGKYPRTTGLLYWTASNKKGVALYHIEKDFHNLAGKNTYKNLRSIINKLQAKK
ncbi:MAG: glycoside hydrolase family 18 [Capnocytophaga sp.]|nr:glycoside hydrolase family 18 [Capnocytophaga sp.]